MPFFFDMFVFQHFKTEHSKIKSPKIISYHNFLILKFFVVQWSNIVDVKIVSPDQSQYCIDFFALF